MDCAYSVYMCAAVWMTFVMLVFSEDLVLDDVDQATEDHFER